MLHKLVIKINQNRKILYITLALSLLVIWGQSFISLKSSEAQSDFFVNLISPLEEIKPDPDAEVPTEEYDFLNHLVRKTAHVIEYTALGVQIMWLLTLKVKKKQAAVNTVFAGMLIGLIDETIQIYSGRGSLVKDVWFDLLGIVIGVLFVYIVTMVYERKNKQVTEEI